MPSYEVPIILLPGLTKECGECYIVFRIWLLTCNGVYFLAAASGKRGEIAIVLSCTEMFLTDTIRGKVVMLIIMR